MNTIIEKLRVLIKMQIRREELNFASLGGGGQTMNIGALEWVLKQLDTLQEQLVKIDIRKELASIEFMGVNDARDSETIARHFYELGRQSKPTTAEGLEEEINRYRKEEMPVVLESDLNDIARHFYELGQQSRPKISDNSLEEEIAGMYQALFGTDVINRKEMLYLDTFEAIARHFAQWQKEKDDKELSEKIASAYQLGLADKEKQMMKDGLDAVKSGQSSKIEKTIAGVFVKYGMDRQKEQMMKDALHGWLDEDIEPPYDLNVLCEEKIPFGKFKHCDKVKIIIVKED